MATLPIKRSVTPIEPHSKQSEALKMLKDIGDLLRQPGERPLGDFSVHFYESSVTGTMSFQILPNTGFIEPQLYLKAVTTLREKTFQPLVGKSINHEEGIE